MKNLQRIQCSNDLHQHSLYNFVLRAVTSFSNRPWNQFFFIFTTQSVTHSIRSEFLGKTVFNNGYIFFICFSAAVQKKRKPDVNIYDRLPFDEDFLLLSKEDILGIQKNNEPLGRGIMTYNMFQYLLCFSRKCVASSNWALNGICSVISVRRLLENRALK